MKVFVSSTYADLIDYRSAVTRAILSAGDVPEDMLYWPADDDEGLEVSLRRLRASDVVVLVLAHRYGTVPNGSQESITHLEFKEALAKRIPVLAFVVDPEFPWPPKHVDTGESERKRLETFRQRVREHGTWRAFTTPESLEAAVGQSIAAHKAKSAPPRLPVFVEKRCQTVQRRESIYHTPDCIVQIGTAPDGLPLALYISRSLNFDAWISGIATGLGRTMDDRFVHDLREKLAYEARTYAISRGRVDSSQRPIGHQTQLYVARRSIADAVSPSVFASLVKNDRMPGMAQATEQPTILSGLEVRGGWFPRITSMGGVNKFMCLSLDTEEVWIGSWTVDAGQNRLHLLRPFIEEGLERMPGVEFIVNRGIPGMGQVVTRTSNIDEWQKAWSDALATADDDEFDALQSQIRVPRAAIAELLLQLIGEVANTHDTGRIHGDIKPSNALVSRRAPMLIDEIGLNPGEVSPAATIGFSPPEQLSRQPLTFAADVYSLGTFTLGVVGGQQLGRQSSYSLPDGKVAVVVRDPTVYLDPASTVLPPEGRKPWFSLIERSLRSDPAQRWPTAKEMHAALAEVIATSPLRGYVTISYAFGVRPSLLRMTDGSLKAGWVIGDAVVPGRAQPSHV